MSKRTELAHGAITNNDHLTIELLEPPDMPPVIRFRWPDKPSLCPPTQFDSVVAAAMRILANAVVELAALKARKRL
jgi:hypothetical protein